MNLPADFFSSLPAGSQVTIVTVTMPGGDATPPSTSNPVLVATSHDGLLAPGPSPASSKLAGPEDPFVKLKDVQKREHGVSRREAQRAMKAGFLPFEEKTDGLDSGAFLIRRSDLQAYCARREGIYSGREAAPDGWTGPTRVFP